jgi:hypothetical protein
LQQGSLVRQINAISRRADLASRLSDDHDARGRKNVAKFLDNRGRERFAAAACKRMKKDERWMLIETRERVSRRKRPAKRLADSGASTFGELEIPVNGMAAAIDSRDTIIKKARTFAPIAHPVDFFGAAYLCDQRTAEQSLKIEHQLGSDGPGFLQPRQQTL